MGPICDGRKYGRKAGAEPTSLASDGGVHNPNIGDALALGILQPTGSGFYSLSSGHVRPKATSPKARALPSVKISLGTSP